MAEQTDYTIRPEQLSETLERIVEIGQPVMVWGPPGVGKSQIAQQVAARTKRRYIDLRALLLDPVDLRGLPRYDAESDTTRWAAPAFLPPTDSTERWLINLEELPAAPPMVQSALYQLVLDRGIGEYRLPDGAAIIACGNRRQDRAATHVMPTPLVSRFVHLELAADPADWCRWAASNGIAPEVIFFIQFRPELLMAFDPRSRDVAFACPRTWEFASGIVQSGNINDIEAERAVYCGALGEEVAVEFVAFLSIFRELAHPQTIIDNPRTATIPKKPSVQIALCGALCRMADDANFPSVITFARRLRPELAQFLLSSCVRRTPSLQYSADYIRWIADNENS